MLNRRPIKASNEHLVFAKNVPQYMAGQITQLFNHYKPTSVRNIYPRSDMTTLVFTFGSQFDAECAQRETDLLRIDYVVLKVETYNDKQSVRALRAKRRARRPVGRVLGRYEADDAGEHGEEKEEEDAEIESVAERSDTPIDTGFSTHPLPAGNPMAGAATGLTWANIAAIKEPRPAALTDTTVDTNLLEIDTTHTTTPQKSHLNLNPPLHDTPASDATSVTVKPAPRINFLANHSPSSISTASPNNNGNNGNNEGDGDDSDGAIPLAHPTSAFNLPGSTEPLASMLSYFPADSAEYVRESHCQVCSFCQYLAARKVQCYGW